MGQYISTQSGKSEFEPTGQNVEATRQVEVSEIGSDVQPEVSVARFGRRIAVVLAIGSSLVACEPCDPVNSGRERGVNVGNVSVIDNNKADRIDVFDNFEVAADINGIQIFGETDEPNTIFIEVISPDGEMIESEKAYAVFPERFGISMNFKNAEPGDVAVVSDDNGASASYELGEGVSAMPEMPDMPGMTDDY